MNQTFATLFGMFILCVWPLLFFAGGVYYARFGLPVTLRWRGIGRIDDEEDL